MFIQLGKVGGCASAQLEALARSISVGLRHGISLKTLSKQLKDIRCPQPNFSRGVEYKSCSDAVAKVMEREHVIGEERRNSEPTTPSDISVSDDGG